MGVDEAKRAEPELSPEGHEDKLVILDEVHRIPGPFQTLRGRIDRGRRKGLRAALLLLPGAASMDLAKTIEAPPLRQPGETLLQGDR